MCWLRGPEDQYLYIMSGLPKDVPLGGFFYEVMVMLGSEGNGFVARVNWRLC
jgi:hypothetical protein